MVHSFTFGETTVFSSAVVNALRVAVNKAKVDNYQTPFFSPSDLGIKMYSYLPGYMTMNVTGGFMLYSGTNTKALFLNDTYQAADDLTIVRGNHQFGIGGNVRTGRATTHRLHGPTATGSSTAPRPVSGSRICSSAA